MRRVLLFLLCALPFAATAAPPPTVRPTAQQGRRMHVESGPYQNDFVQNEKLSMHTIVRTNEQPRILFATPAGNTGVGLWFKQVKGRGIALRREAEPVEQGGVAGVALALKGPKRLELDRAMLDSMRALRDKEQGAEAGSDKIVKEALAAFASPAGRAAGATPEMIDRLKDWVEPKQIHDPARPDALILERRAFGSGARYRVEIVPEAGTTITREGGTVVLSGKSGTQFSVRSFIDRAPLTPKKQILKDPAADPQQERNLGFLVFDEKLVAGSYQYLTYFGRDALITSKLMHEQFTPEVLATAVGSVLDRVSPFGRVAHEESNGDHATLEALQKLTKQINAGKAKLSPSMMGKLEKPTFDYKMMDGEFLLPPLIVDYVERVSPADVKKTLGPARIAALAKVVGRVLDETQKWSGGSVSELVHLRRGQIVGNWRDSGEGLGWGKAPLDVNAYLVPAALAAVDKMLALPGFPKDELVASLKPEQRAQLGSLAARQQLWKKASDKFDVTLSGKDASARLGAYLKSYSPKERAYFASRKLWSGQTVGEVLAAGTAGITFPGLSLDKQGKPIPVMSSDEGFQLFYGEPTKAEVVASVTRVFQPFPVGLLTDIGLVTANPGYSPRAGDHELFDRTHYHGTPVWRWQQNMMRRGLERQLARWKRDPEVTAVVKRALGELDRVDANVGALRGVELLSWKVQDDQVVPVQFGASKNDRTEAAADQLWSNTN